MGRLDLRQRWVLVITVCLATLLFWNRPFLGVPPELARVEWVVLGRADGWGPVRVVGLGPGIEGPDVWLAWARLEGGRVAGVELAVDVTATPRVAERVLVSRGGAVAYASGPTGGGVTHVEVIETDRAVPRAEALSWLERVTAWASAVDRWGQGADPRLTRLELGAAEREVDLAFEGRDRLRVDTSGGAVTVDVERGVAAEGAERAATVARLSPASPSPFRFAVDSLRHGELVGPERLQALEGVYHAASDSVSALREALPEQLADDDEERLPGRRAAGSIDGWPPPDLPPRLTRPRRGEGEWVERDEQFAFRPPGAPPPLYTTFLRTDPERPRTSRVYVAIWDPAWVELDFVAGTLEPRSESGLRGTGAIPPDALERLVAGFNGGFQTADSPSGLRTTQGLFLPAVPYHATVARLEDGRIALGTWPLADPKPAPTLYRQNLQPLLEDGVIDPFRRRFWGGTQRGRSDTTRTDRSGLCLTTRGHMAYLWGRHITPDAFGEAMRALDCTYGMMLDINSTNTVFESYRVARALPPLDRALDPYLEHEGVVPEHEGLRYRMQSLAGPMTEVGRPRFVRRELRDFFYLAIRPEVLAPPCASICAPRPRPDGGGGPPRVYECELDGALAGVAVSAFDLRRTRARGAAPAEGPSALALAPAPHGGTTAAWDPEDGLEGVAIRGADASRVAATGDEAGVVVGTTGPWLVLARAPRRLAAATARRLAGAGIARAIFVSGAWPLALERDPTPMAVRIFEDTDPVPRHAWRPRTEKLLRMYRETGLTRIYVTARSYQDGDAEE